MAKFSLKLTKRYLRDLKLARKRGMDESLLNEIIVKLLDDVPLPEKNRDHQLHGDYEGYRESVTSLRTGCSYTSRTPTSRLSHSRGQALTPTCSTRRTN